MHAILTTYKNLTLKMITSQRPRPIGAYFALGAVCVIWGTTYLALRIGVTQFPPFLFSVMRFILAVPILVGFMLTVGKASLPGRKSLFNQAIAGLLMVTLGISVVGWAEMYVSSGLAAIICSMMPIWVILINVSVNRDERPTFPIVLGLLIGLSGIIMIFAVLLGWLVLDEKLNMRIGVAILITIAGIYIVNKGYQLKDVWRAQFSKS